MLDRSNVVVVIPALNEALRIRDVVEGALAQCDQVIVIDDGSDDDTAARIDDLQVTVLRHEQRMGKGASLRQGFATALRRDCAAVLTMDGDGQHAAADIPRLIAAGNRHPEHIVIGARLRKRSLQPAYRRAANAFADWGIGMSVGYRIADTQSGQRLYPAAVAALTDVPGEDFVFEAQILVSAALQLGTRCVSVPIESRYHARDASPDDTAPQFRASHFKPWRDFSQITRHITGDALRRRGLLEMHRRLGKHPALIDDPSGEFSSPSCPPTAGKQPDPQE